ncbi:sigma-54-dependent Fis family transcriptional regulator [bacterium]|nr:MAG: sigma-54-dependent Fis family transcriptional regulator [bacterium]
MSESLVIISSRDTGLYPAGLAIAGQDYQLVVHEEPAETLAAAQEHSIALVVLDLRHYSEYPESLVTRLRLSPSEPELLVLLAEGLDSTALPAECSLNAPVANDQVIEQGQRLLHLQEVRQRSGIVGNSAALREVLATIAQVGPLDVPVLVQGESGTGKELVARGVHEQSRRSKAAFVSINVGSLAESLLESELFGHEKGAFTGAIARHAGVFERADGGTLFLDELGEMSPRMQVKLLRVLETGEFTRVGGSGLQHTDVRIVAATHRDLELEMAEGRFRGDLYYRLKVVRIDLPALRDRPDDILPLAENFLRATARRHNLKIRGWTRAAMAALLQYAWPGNVRELRNVVDASAVLSRSELIELEDLPEELRGHSGAGPNALPVRHAAGFGASPGEAGIADRTVLRILAELHRLSDRIDELSSIVEDKGADSHGPPFASGQDVERVDAEEWPDAQEAEFDPVVSEMPADLAGAEKAMIAAALRQNDGNRRRAADQLGIAERTLYRKLHRYGLS